MKIYDRSVEIHSVTGDGVLGRRISASGTDHYCAERTVGLQRFFTALQVGDRIDIVLELPGRISVSSSAVAVYDGDQHRIVQVQHALDDDGLEITVLSLSRLESDYDFDTV